MGNTIQSTKVKDESFGTNGMTGLIDTTRLNDKIYLELVAELDCGLGIIHADTLQSSYWGNIMSGISFDGLDRWWDYPRARKMGLEIANQSRESFHNSKSIMPYQRVIML
jgi:hypothetical protein